jgi:glycosyltransferase involved in cell wall biosynthesis
MIWHSWRFTSRRPFDAVNAHWLVPAGVAAWIVNKTRRIPYVVTVHGADAYTLNGRLSRWVKRRVLRSSAAVLPVSADIGKVVRDVGGRRIHIDHVVPMGVGQRSVVVTERTPGAFLFVGRLADKKGVEVAIRALPAVPQACLRIVGEGPARSHLVDLVDQLGLTDQVEFLGRLGREEVFSQMERCFGLLIPSVTAPDGDRDGTPVVLAEAMSCGTTVIASDIAGLGDQIEDGDTGWLVPPGDVGALSRMLTRALADAEGFIELGREARERFSGGPLDIRSTAAVYRKVLAEVTP